MPGRQQTKFKATLPPRLTEGMRFHTALGDPKAPGDQVGGNIAAEDSFMLRKVIEMGMGDEGPLSGTMWIQPEIQLRQMHSSPMDDLNQDFHPIIDSAGENRKDTGPRPLEAAGRYPS